MPGGWIRTTDLTLIKRTLLPTELPGLLVELFF